MSWLGDVGATGPVVAAPMAGGPSTPELVLAAAGAGALGFLAGGYLSPAALGEQLARVRAGTDAYGVNLFAPRPVPVDHAAYAAYRDRLAGEAASRGVELPVDPVEDDDSWRDKVDVLVADPVPVVSFTFGIPDTVSRDALRRSGSRLIQTVTSVEEARQAVAAGMDALVVQAGAAGGHSGTFTPERLPPETPLPRLLADVRAAVDVPLLGAGGIGGPTDVVAALAAGADAGVVGTLLLLADEAGTSAAHRAGLAEPERGTTVMRAWTGRPARGLRNAFSEAYDASAPSGYPALHHLTRPLRRAAAAASDPDGVNLWAGTCVAGIRPGPAAEILTSLAEGA